MTRVLAILLAVLLVPTAASAAQGAAFDEADIERLEAMRKQRLATGFGLFGASIGVTAGSAALLASSFDSDTPARIRRLQAGS